MFKKAKENKKGFTLAELLIVVAIIAVLVAISIPIFTAQLEKSKEVTLKQAKNDWQGGAPEIAGVKLAATINHETAVTVTVTDSSTAPTFKQGNNELKSTN